MMLLSVTRERRRYVRRSPVATPRPARATFCPGRSARSPRSHVSSPSQVSGVHVCHVCSASRVAQTARWAEERDSARTESDYRWWRYPRRNAQSSQCPGWSNFSFILRTKSISSTCVFRCWTETVIVPSLEPLEECFDVPREVCSQKRGGARSVLKPLVKKDCIDAPVLLSVLP